MSLTLDLAAYLKARPWQWIDGRDLGRIAGSYAWRTRLSECRTSLGMTIANYQRRGVSAEGRRFTLSYYRYEPPAATLLDLIDAPHQTC